ncbi:MAG: TolC family protein [Proteobacteria bacterium]|nr:TolC family protein [Pseudomonadota bacterium]
MKTITTYILAVLIVLVSFCPSWADENEGTGIPVDAEGAQVVPGDTALDTPPLVTPPDVAPRDQGARDLAAPDKKKTPDTSQKIEKDPAQKTFFGILALKDFVRLVMEKNETVLAQHLDYQISQETITGERAVFEPEFVNSYQRSNDHSKYSNEDKTSILFASEKDERAADFNAMVEGKIPTGAKLKAGYTLREYKDRASSTAQDQFKGYLGLEITQPLLKGGGDAIVASIKVAKMDSKLAFQALRLKRMETALNALSSCWDLYGAKEKLAIRKASVQIAQTILTDNRERFKLGKMAETEILEAEAGLAKRKSQESRGQQDLISAMNQVRTYVSLSDASVPLMIDFSDHEKIERIFPDLNDSVNDALKNRPEYLAAKKKINRENILIRYAENQRWPQLDLTGSYGINGLGDSPGDSWTDELNEDYHTWKVGATLTIPLLGGLKTRSELAIAEHHKRQALLQLKSAEVEIANRVDTSVKEVYSAFEQVDYSIRARKVYQRLLDVELVMLDAGRSNSRSVLDKEEDLNYARESEIENVVYSKKAVLGLDMAQGLLLKHYGIDVSEEGLE